MVTEKEGGFSPKNEEKNEVHNPPQGGCALGGGCALLDTYRVSAGCAGCALGCAPLYILYISLNIYII